MTIADRPWSIALLFMSTIFWPFLPYDATTDSFSFAIARSRGMTSASLKKADCMIMLMRPPRPISIATFTASTL